MKTNSLHIYVGQGGGDGLGGQLAGLQNMSEEDRQAALLAMQDDVGQQGGGGGGGMGGRLN